MDSELFPLDWSSHAENAEKFVEEGDYQSALDCLTEAIELLVSSAEEADMLASLPLFLKKAECRLRMGDWEDALEVFCQLESLTSASEQEESNNLAYEAILGQARIHRLTSDLDRALELLERVLRGVPDPELTLHQRAVFETGHCLVECGRIEDGVAAMQSALNFFAADCKWSALHHDCLLRLSRILFDNGDLNGVQEALEQFLVEALEQIGLLTIYGELYVLLGRSFMQQGKAERAEECFQSSVKCFQESLGPQCAEIAQPLCLAAQLRLMGSSPLDALPMIEKAYELTLDSDDHLELHADICRDLGQLHLEVTLNFKEARRYFERAGDHYEQEGDQFIRAAREVRWFCGTAFVKEGRYDQAIDIFEQLISLYDSAESGVLIQRAMELALLYQSNDKIQKEYELWNSTVESLEVAGAPSGDRLLAYMQLTSSCMALGKDKVALECTMSIRNHLENLGEECCLGELPELKSQQTDIVELDHLNIPGMTQMRKLSDQECLFIKQHFMQVLDYLERQETPEVVCSLLEKAARASARIAGDKADLYSKLAELYGAQGQHELAQKAHKLAEPRAAF